MEYQNVGTNLVLSCVLFVPRQLTKRIQNYHKTILAKGIFKPPQMAQQLVPPIIPAATLTQAPIAAPFGLGGGLATIRRGRGKGKTTGATLIPVAGPNPCPGMNVVAPIPDLNQHVTTQQRQQMLAQAQQREEELPTLVIERSFITLYSYEELKQLAVCSVTNTESEGMNSINDPRMGVTRNNMLCASCHKDNIECPGHLGMIEFHKRYPLYHPMFMRDIIRVLTCVCNSCGGLLLTSDEIKERKLDRYSGVRRLELLEAACEGLQCRTERFPKDYPRPAGVMRCLPNPTYIASKLKDTHQICYQYKGREKREKKDSCDVKQILEVAEILRAISPEDAELMGFKNGSHPSRMILRALPVIPPIARPPVIQNGEEMIDDLTQMYIHIIRLKIKLEQDRDETERKDTIAQLFRYVSHFIDNTDGTMGQGRHKVYKSIKERIQGKEEAIRGSLMGKRVNYSGRTVISPDPSLKFGQMRIPKAMAPVLTVNVVVAQFNRKEMQDLLAEGKITYITPIGGKFPGRRRQVLESNRNMILQLGDKVERWLRNGDYILFNRQPTIHKQGIMGYEVVLGDELTIGLHLSYTTPHNADF